MDEKVNAYQERWKSAPKWRKRLIAVIAGIIFAVAICFVFGLVVQWLWNWLMPDLFSLRQITYWQAFGIVLLSRLIFCSFWGGSYRRSKSSEKKKLEEAREEKSETPERPKGWQYYDEWWEKEGKKAFDDYTDKRTDG